MIETVDATDAAPPPARFVYELGDAPKEKIRKIARTVYGADDVAFTATAEKDLKRIDALGGSNLPVCMAKTQYSFTTDPTRLGAPEGLDVHIREVRLAAGAGFVVAICGDILTMPGLPRHPAAEGIGVDAGGGVTGLD